MRMNEEKNKLAKDPYIFRNQGLSPGGGVGGGGGPPPVGNPVAGQPPGGAW